MTAASQEPTTGHAYQLCVPTLLSRRLRLTELEAVAARRVIAHVLDIELDLDVFTFPCRAGGEQEAREAMIAELSRYGTPLEVVPGAGTDFAGPVVVLKEGRVEETMIGEDPKARYRTRSSQTVKSDLVAVERFSRLTGLRVRYCYGPDLHLAPFHEEDGTLNLFMNGRPPGLSKFRTHVSKLYGRNLWENGEERVLYSPTFGRGRLIESEGVPIFQMIGNNAYQLTLILSVSDICNTYDRPAILNGLLGSLAWDLARPREMPDDSALDADAYGHFIRQMAVSQSNAKREDVQRLDREIEDAQRQLAEKIRRRMNDVTALRAFEEEAARLAARLEDDFRRLKAHPKVCAMRPSVDDGLTITTAPIVLEHEGRRYDLGPFQIQLDTDGDVAVWSEAPRHPEGHHHPHVHKTQLECFGNITQSVTKLAASYRFADAAVLIIRWLETYNPSLTLIPLEEFPSEPIATIETA